MGNLSLIAALFIVMKGFTVERNPIYVNYVGKPSVVVIPLVTMKGFTDERNPMYVSYVKKLIYDQVPYKHMNKSI